MATTEFFSGYGLYQKNEKQGMATRDNINVLEML